MRRRRKRRKEEPGLKLLTGATGGLTFTKLPHQVPLCPLCNQLLHSDIL